MGSSALKGRRQPHRGQALGVVLAVAALALLAAFTAAGVSTMNMRVSTRLSNVAIADALAESVIQEALAHLQGDLTYQKDISLDAGLGLPEGSRGSLRFGKTLTGPYSTNNYTGDQTTGWNREVPAQSIHLIGVGESGGVTRMVEVVAHMPGFPVAMVCDGPVIVTDTTIGSIASPGDLIRGNNGSYTVAENKLKPGHLVTNSQSQTACVLDQPTLVTGDIQARGSVVPNGARIEGEVRSPYSGIAPVPEFNLVDFDPKANPNVHYEALSGTFGSLDLVGNVRHDGSLTLSGDLNLDNAYLFVDGDLTVRGNLQGVGAVIVTGKAVFDGTVALASSKQIAVLSGKGLELTGKGATQSVFHGLLYTKGPFYAKSVTILGGFITDDGAPATVEHCNIYHSDVSIIPKMQKEAFAAVVRFSAVPSLPAELFHDATGFPSGRWRQGDGEGETRTVDNVLDRQAQNWRSSFYDEKDVAGVQVRWINDEPQYRFIWHGFTLAHMGGPVPKYEDLEFTVEILPSETSWYMNRDEFLDEVSLVQSGGLRPGDLKPLVISPDWDDEFFRKLIGDPTATWKKPILPIREEYRAYLNEVTDHLEDQGSEEQVNFVLDPSFFLSLGDRLRIQLHRKL